MTPDIRVIRLPNGIRLATISLPHMASVATGLWAGAGSRHESESEHGMAHFVEHLLFKGTPTRVAEDISRQIEGLGANIDAFTVEDHTCFHTRAPAERFGEMLDVLADFYQNPVFDPQEVEFERRVVREEIAMVRDQPSQWLEDLGSESAWGETHPLGRSITGTEESLASLNRASIFDFFHRCYSGANTVISVAGKIEHDAVLAAVGERWGTLNAGGKAWCEPAPPFHRGHRFEESVETEQAHVALSFRSAHQHDPARFSQKLLSMILGENMSSRLFQLIREQQGLCYEIQSEVVSWQDAGLLQIFTALHPDNLREALGMVSRIIDDLCEYGVSDEELRDAKSFLIGQSRISLENTASQMMWAGESLLAYDQWIDPEEIHDHVMSVTASEVREAARQVLRGDNMSTAIIGSYQANSVLLDWAGDQLAN